MDATGVNALPESAAIDGEAGSTSSLSSGDLSDATDEQLMVLAARGNTRAILLLELRDAARGTTLLGSGNQPVPAAELPAVSPAAGVSATKAVAVTLDAPAAILGLEQPDAAQAAKLLASVDETAAAAAEEAVGNMVDKFA